MTHRTHLIHILRVASLAQTQMPTIIDDVHAGFLANLAV